MLNRRDPIFWMAAAIFVVSFALAAAFGQGFLLLMVGAYLLRPTLHSLGFYRKLADEREMQIQYRAGNVAFAAMTLGVIVVIVRLMATGDHAWEMLVPVLLFSLAARALARLLMEGDLAVAGPRIVIAVGLFLVLFGLLEGGVALPSTVSHGLPGLALVLLGLAARKRPRPVALVLLALAAVVTALVVASALGMGRQLMWGTVVAVALIVIPLIVAAVCLLRAPSLPGDETPAHAVALLVTLSLALAGAANANAQTKPHDCKPWGTKTWRAVSCTLAYGDTVLGHRMRAGTKLFFDTTDALRDVWFKRDTQLEGFFLRGSGEGPSHVFYADVTPKMLWLARTQDVDGVPCRPISFWTEVTRHTSSVLFHRSGRLEACTLGRAVTIQGHTFSKGSRVHFDAAGAVIATAR